MLKSARALSFLPFLGFALYSSIAFSADVIRPKSACEALAVANSREKALEFVETSEPLDAISITYFPPPQNKFEIEFSNNEVNITLSTWVILGNSKGQCGLSEANIVSGD